MSVVCSTAVAPSSILPSALMPLADVQPVCSSMVTSPADHSLTSVPFSAALTLASASEAPTAAAVLDRWTVHPKKVFFPYMSGLLSVHLFSALSFWEFDNLSLVFCSW